MDVKSVDQLLRERQDKFVERRTVIENEVNQFLKSLESLDHVYKQQLQVIDGRTAKDVLPALWAEPFVQETYDAQKAELDKYIASVQAVCDQLNEEALRCLQES